MNNKVHELEIATLPIRVLELRAILKAFSPNGQPIEADDIKERIKRMQKVIKEGE